MCKKKVGSDWWTIAHCEPTTSIKLNKILSKHLAANKEVSFAFQQKSSTMPMMNPSPTEIVDFHFLWKSHLSSMLQSRDTSLELQQRQLKQNLRKSIRWKLQWKIHQKRSHKLMLVLLNPKSKGQSRGSPPTSPPKNEPRSSETKKGGKGGGKGKRGKSEPRHEKRKQQCIPFFRGMCTRGDQRNYQKVNQFQQDLRSSRSVMKQSRSSLTIRHRPGPSQHPREVLGSLPQ